jgi:hypothetical protein
MMAETFNPEGTRRRDTPPAPQPQPARVAEVKAQRRRRDDSSETLNRRLFVPDRFKDPNYEYRWLNDDGGRIQEKTQFDDWDIVTSSDMGPDYKETAARDADGGTGIRRQVGKQDGKPVFAYLCRKPKQFHEEDQARKRADIDAMEETMRRGPLPSPQGLGQSEGYVPAGHRNVIGRG